MAGPLFWPKMVLARPLFRPIMIYFFFFLPSIFLADQSLSNNTDNLSVHRSMFCLPRSVKHSRYKNMILKLTPVITTLTIIKELSFEVRVHQTLL